jgi:hypothetical protein
MSLAILLDLQTRGFSKKFRVGFLNEDQFLSALKLQYGGKNKHSLIDEMQVMIGNANVERTVREFCRSWTKMASRILELERLSFASLRGSSSTSTR